MDNIAIGGAPLKAVMLALFPGVLALVCGGNVRLAFGIPLAAVLLLAAFNNPRSKTTPFELVLVLGLLASVVAGIGFAVWGAE